MTDREDDRAVARILPAQGNDEEQDDGSMWVEKASTLVQDDEDEVGPSPLVVAGAKGRSGG